VSLLPEFEHSVFSIQGQQTFNALALDLFYEQAQYCLPYSQYLAKLGVNATKITAVEDIPYLPLQLFKRHKVLHKGTTAEVVFSSSGTTGQFPSQHHVASEHVYRTSFMNGFERVYGTPSEYCVVALLPAYLERKGSSLVYMANALIEASQHSDSGFYLNQYAELAKKLKELDASGQKVLLIGVTFGLLDLLEETQFELKHTIVMETGGMKGRRKEMVREELHEILCKGFGVENIHSEYGMTELLSQAYSKGNGIFHCPPWMKVTTREINDPLSKTVFEKIGGINVIDLANMYSCSFLATQDLGKIHTNNTFEILGRFDESEMRGCNLLAL